MSYFLWLSKMWLYVKVPNDFYYMPSVELRSFAVKLPKLVYFFKFKNTSFNAMPILAIFGRPRIIYVIYQYLLNKLKSCFFVNSLYVQVCLYSSFNFFSQFYGWNYLWRQYIAIIIVTSTDNPVLSHIRLVFFQVFR